MSFSFAWMAFASVRNNKKKEESIWIAVVMRVMLMWMFRMPIMRYMYWFVVCGGKLCKLYLCFVFIKYQTLGPWNTGARAQVCMSTK